MARNRRGFTLVELLVVVAIISVLAALLLPSMEQALFSAREVRCSANIRNQYTAQMFYSEDHRGHFAPHKEVGPDYSRWGSSVALGVPALRVTMDSYISDSQVMLCPLHQGTDVGTQKAFVDLRYSAGNYGAWDSGAANVFSAYMWYANFNPGLITTTDGSPCCPKRASDCRPNMIFINHRMGLYDWWRRIQDFGHSGDVASAATGLPAGPWVSRSSANGFADGHVSVVAADMMEHRLNWLFTPGGTRLFY